MIAADCSPWAPALYEADARYLVERITEPGYLEHLLEICKKEAVDAVLPCLRMSWSSSRKIGMSLSGKESGPWCPNGRRWSCAATNIASTSI